MLNHSFATVLQEMLAENLLTQEEVGHLAVCVSSLAELPDQQSALRRFASYQLTVGQYWAKVKYSLECYEDQAKDRRDAMKAYWRQKGLPGGGRSDRAIDAQVRNDAVLVETRPVLARLRYFLNQLDELREAFRSRRRTLEQYANNTRHNERVELGES